MGVRWPFTARNPPLLVGSSRKARLNFVPIRPSIMTINGSGGALATPFTVVGLPASAVAMQGVCQLFAATGATVIFYPNGGSGTDQLLQIELQTAVELVGPLCGMVTPGLTNQLMYVMLVATGAWSMSITLTGYWEPAA